jgi:hypothetical protein
LVTLDKFNLLGFQFQRLILIAKHRDLIVLVNVVVYVRLVALVDKDQVIWVYRVELALDIHCEGVHVAIVIFHVDIELVFVKILYESVYFFTVVIL